METRHDDAVIKLLIDERERRRPASAHVSFDPEYTQLYVERLARGVRRR